MNYEATWEQHLARFREADSLYRAGDMRSAKRVFFKALALSPGDVDTLWALGSCFSESGKPHSAERYFRRARARAAWRRKGDLLYNIANSLFDQGRLQAALRLYIRVPRSSKAFLLARRNASTVRRKLVNPSIKPGWGDCGETQRVHFQR